MRSLLNKASLAIALAVGGAATFSAVGLASSSHATGQARHGVQVIQLTTATAQEAFVDAAPSDFSVGDSYVFSEDVFKGSKRIGDAGAECTTVRIDKDVAVVKCSETYRLPDGQILAEGLISFDPAVGGGSAQFTWAITGGTGAYRTARGEVNVVETNAGANSTLEFRIAR